MCITLYRFDQKLGLHNNSSKSVNRELVKSWYLIGTSLALDFGYNLFVVTIMDSGESGTSKTIITINSVIVSGSSLELWKSVLEKFGLMQP